MAIVALIAPLIAPHDPIATNIAIRVMGPSWEHWLGTDELGRDILSRMLYGARASVVVGISATAAGCVLGSMIGIFSGYVGGKTDLLIQRFMDMIMTFPGLILAIAMMVVLGQSERNVIIAIAIPGIPGANRIVRSVALSVKQFQYVEAAKALGVKRFGVLVNHVLPNCLAPFLIIVTSTLGGTVLAEASLSFLGLGIPAPQPSWGRSLMEAQPYFYTSPMLAVIPGIAISLVVFSANMLGDGLRDVWDPRLKKL